MPVPVNTNSQVQALIDEFVIKGGFRLLLDETVVPVAIVSELATSSAGEIAAIGGSRRNGANLMTHALCNDVGSGVDLLLDALIWSASHSGPVDLGFAGTFLANTDNYWNRDLRLAVAPPGVPRYEDLAANPAGGTLITELENRSNQQNTVNFDPPFIIPPGVQVWLQNPQAAGAQMATWLWRSRPPV